MELGGYTTAYETTEIDPSLLSEWENVLAVRCRQTTGGQSIDAGLDRIIPAKP